MKIKNKISLIVILSITFTALAALFITIKIARNTFEEQFHSQAEYAIKASKGGIENALTRAYETSLTLASSPLVSNWIEHEGEASHANIHNLTLAGLEELIQKRKYAVAFLGNKRTNSYYIGKKSFKLSKENPNDAWFYKTLNSGVEISPSISYDDKVRKTMLWVNALVLENGETKGVTGVGLDIEKFISDFKKSIPTSNSTLLLVDSKDKILVSSNDQNIGKTVYSLAPESQEAKQHLNSNNTYEFFGDDNNLNLLVKSKISDTGLSIYLIAPQRDFVPSIINLGGIAFLIVIVLTAISILGVISILTIVFKKINTVIGVANSIAKGDLSVKFELNSNDEIGALASAMRKMVTALKIKAELIDKMSQGDFSVEVDLASEKDSLGKSLQLMLQNLNQLLNQINAGSIDLGSSSEQLSAISTQITSATTEMSSQAGTVSGASNQMTSNIATSASGAEEMSANIQSISATTTEMSQSMTEVSQTMENLSQSINTVSEKSSASTAITGKASEMSHSATVMMSELSLSAHKIGEITEVIKEIAQQTNLLALNANIEAASAGEAGKGFAVVANEIKELAQQSSSSAESISATVKDIQDKTKASETSITEITSIISEITQSSEEVKTISFKGVESVNDILQNIKESAVGINEIAKMINEISLTAQEFARTSGELRSGSDEITKNIAELDIVVKETSAGISKVNEQAKTLFGMADRQREMVGKFSLSDKN